MSPRSKKLVDADLGIEADDDVVDEGLGIVAAPAEPPPARDPQGVMTVGEPQAIKTPKADPFHVFLAKGAQGATMRLGDEISSAGAAVGGMLDRGTTKLQAALGDPAYANQAEADAIPRTYADDGSEYTHTRDEMRDDLHKGERDYAATPWYSDPNIGGEVAGGILPALATAGGSAAEQGGARVAEPLAERVGAGLGRNAALGAVVGYGGSDSDDFTGQLEDAEVGAMMGAGVGAVGDAVLPAAIGFGADKAKQLSSWAQKKALESRAAASGAYGSQLSQLLQERGEEGIADIGAEIERAGLHKTGKWYQPFAGPKTYLRNATELADKSGKQIGESLDTATAAGVGEPLDDIAAAQRATAGQVPRYDTAGQSARDAANREIDQFESAVAGQRAEAPRIQSSRPTTGAATGDDPLIYAPPSVRQDALGTPIDDAPMRTYRVTPPSETVDPLLPQSLERDALGTPVAQGSAAARARPAGAMSRVGAPEDVPTRMTTPRPRPVASKRVGDELPLDPMTLTPVEHGNPLVSPRALHGQKRGLEAQIYGPLKVKGETPKIDALRQLANTSRTQMYGMMERQAAPEVNDAFTRAMKDKQTAEIVKTLSGKRVGQEMGNHLASLPGLEGGAMGGVAAGAPGAALGIAGIEGLKRYGKDALASGMHGVEHTFGGIGRVLEPAAAGAPVASRAAAQRAAGEQTSTAANGLRGAFMQPMAAGDDGSHAPRRATQSALSDPEYGPMLQQLDPEERATRIGILEQTDANFRKRNIARSRQQQEH